MNDKIVTEDLFSQGYGVIPKNLMLDRDISLSAKAIYAYFCSYTGAGDTCFPSYKKIAYDLGISSDTIRKYLSELQGNGYIEIKQNKENSRFANNIYRLPCRKLPYRKISDTENSVPENVDTKNNNTKNNSYNNINNDSIYQAEFEELWQKYPNKKGKDMALKSYIKARKSGVSRETIEKGIENYAEYCRNKDKQYIKHGSTWFNQKSWQDEYTAENKPVKKSAFDVLRELCEEAENEEAGNIDGVSFDMFELPEYKG